MEANMTVSLSTGGDMSLSRGVEMPVVGLGTWQLRGREATQAVQWALETGYRLLDTATMYRNEAEIGAALRESGVPREDIFLTTKLPPDRAGEERETLQRSLDALDTDYVDLWLVHWPPNGAGVDSWRAFGELAEQGLARAIGVSNYSTAQLDELISATGVTPAVNQVEWSPKLFDRTLLDENRERGVVLEGYSPFKAGRLDDPVLTGLAERYGKTPAQVVVRWHVEHGVVVIPKSARRERIAANFDVFDFTLDPADVEAIDALADDR
jgi:diketogulonate reductase-like aldo/keto reductase